MSAAGCSQGTVAKGLGMPLRTFEDCIDPNNGAYDADLRYAYGLQETFASSECPF